MTFFRIIGLRALATVLPCLFMPLCSCLKPESPAPPAVILVVLDTVRYDHFGAAGYFRNTTPHLDRLATEGAWFENAWSQAPWTLPAMATILTGRQPSTHGAGMRAGQLFSIRTEVDTLAETVRRHHIQTGAVVNVVFCNPASGIARGFERYDFNTSNASNRNHRNAAATTDAALRWVERVRDRPFFLMVHYFDAHLTYDPPAPYDSKFLGVGSTAIPSGFGNASEVLGLRDGSIAMNPDQRSALVARYDGEIAFLDSQFGRLRAGLEASGRWDDALVIVVADHGEEFWDHDGFEHGHTHYPELLHVPLIVRGPGYDAGEIRKERVSQIDIFPTVLNYFNLETDPELPGAVLGTESVEPGRPVLSEGTLWGGDLISVRSSAGTLIRNRTTGRTQLFDSADSPETDDLGSRNQELLRRMEALLNSVATGELLEGESRDPDSGELERLRSLGYIR